MGLKIDFIADKSLCSNVGLVRKANEDNCGFAQTLNGNLFVVCDGMGGHVGGATASKIGVNSIIEYLSKEKYPNIRQSLHDAMVFANIQILGTAKENPALKSMGTTACILLVADNEVWIAHAGDSRIYLYVDNEKFLHRITKDHSYVQGLVDNGEIRDEEAENHPQKNIILKALGIKEDIKPTVCVRPVYPAKNDIFLICSDGLSGMIDDNLIESVLKKEITLSDKVKELIYLALQNGGKDNVTAQLIQITGSSWKNTKINGNEYTPAWRLCQLTNPPVKKNRLLRIAATVAVIALLLFIGGILVIRHNNQKETKMKTQYNDSIKQAKKEIISLDSIIKTFTNEISLQETFLTDENKKLDEIKKTADNEAIKAQKYVIDTKKKDKNKKETELKTHKEKRNSLAGKIKGWEKELEDINLSKKNTENKQDKQTQKSDSK
jgi:serine/threonine protein phosphatase PrpC